MGTSPEAIARGPEYRLFDAAAVGIAAFICCPLAGSILIAVNYFRLREFGKGILAVVLGLIITTFNVLLRFNWNTPPGSLDRLEYDAFEILLFIVAWVCTWKVAKEEQGYAVEKHTARGGQLGSRGTAFGIGIATLAALIVASGAVVYTYRYRKIVAIGTKDQVIYSGLATRANAIALGKILKSTGYFQELGASVLLNKGIDTTTISFAVQDGVWNQRGMLSSFEELARQVAPMVGGLPVQVQLLAPDGDVKETSTVGEVIFDGRDGVYYEGSVTKAEAKALGQRFRSMGFFRAKGANVFFIRHDGDRTTLAFVIVREASPILVSSFEHIVRDVAPAAGGLPIQMRLVSPQLQIKKDEIIQ
jgi:hypothetical protein